MAGADPRGQSATAGEIDRLVTLLGRIGVNNAPDISPDGSQVAFVSDLSGLPQAWTVPARGGFPRRLTTFDDQVLEVRWSPRGDALAVLVAPGGGLNSQIYVLRPDGSDVRLLTLGGADNNWLGPWTPDGRRLAISSNRRDGAAVDAYVVEVASGEVDLVSASPGISWITSLSADGRLVTIDRLVQRGDSDVYLVDLTTGIEQCITRHEPPVRFYNSRMAPGGERIYLCSNEGRELGAFASVEIVNGRPGRIQYIVARDDAELDEVELSSDGRLAALVWNVAGRSELELVEIPSGRRRMLEVPAEVIASPRIAEDGTFLVCSATGAAQPTDIWRAEAANSGLTQITTTSHPGIILDDLVRPTLERFRAHDGLDLSGWLYMPRAVRSPVPMVLSFHGGPESQERPYFARTYQALLASGIGVFAPNVRGSSGFGKTFMNLDNGALRVNGVRDIKACVEHVVAQGYADPRRMGITGGSYGGYMTMAGLTEFPELFAAGVCVCGIVNFETFFKHTQPWMASISKIEYGDPDSEADLLRSLSPIHRLDRVRGATLVLHGANDTNVPVIEAEQIVTELKRRGVPVDLILFPDEGHGFRKVLNRARATVETVRWFTEHLATPTR